MKKNNGRLETCFIPSYSFEFRFCGGGIPCLRCALGFINGHDGMAGRMYVGCMYTRIKLITTAITCSDRAGCTYLGLKKHQSL